MPNSASACAITVANPADGAPITCVCARAGFASGPSKLNTVRIFNSRRTPCTFFMAGCKCGANKNPNPISRTAPAASSGVIAMRTPNASSTSALPTFPEIARFPCLATFAPAPANTIAATVEMLNVPAPSPPVPTISITSAPGIDHNHVLAHGPSEPRQLRRRLALHMQCDQKRARPQRRRARLRAAASWPRELLLK